jgi:ATP-binding cassette subfamily B protein IrtA
VNRPETGTKASLQPITITNVVDITEWYRRIDCDTNGLLAKLPLLPGDYLWLEIPANATTTAHSAVSDRSATTVRRAYTHVGADPQTERLSLYVVVHGQDAPGSAWATTVQPGDQVFVSPGTPVPAVPGDDSAVCLIGDMTAWPAIMSISESLPPDRPVNYVLIDDHPDRQTVITATDTTGRRITWADDVNHLEKVLADLVTSDMTLWGAGEKQLIKTIRAAGRTRGISRDRLLLQTYWINR